MPSERVLYSFRRCPYAIRARLALAISQTPCTLREVHLARKPAAMLAVSPKATVPVLVDGDGTVLDESIDIMRWALTRNDPEGWLDRDDAALIAQNDGPFKHDLDRYKYPERHDADAAVHRQRGLAFLVTLDARLSGSRHLCGPNRGMTDAAIMPFVRQFAGVDKLWFAAQSIPGVQRWLAGHLASPLFATVMTRVAPWTPGDPETAFPPPGPSQRPFAATPIVETN
ncbi:glutathione S-transferase [Erythrobacter arachoides]|uniref:Glutathione S-transferase n=1 Tax=Aurantiacibacter arachoides TaxID=1850444 RepID=A0A844ZYY7_9SPHN|nr:glutathione S-transferase [Aurantiacibacter arachoides]MXO92674.1 glutathione S-transferase [Aurantiacibacter arachoides]GGD55317.1 glutathione S-transferase [Aurantiacibacter arachoides]